MPMRKAFLYSVLLHVAVAAVAWIGLPGGEPLPVEEKQLIDVEIADLTETTERRAPNPRPKPQPKPVAEAEPQPEETRVAALPPQPKPVDEPPAPEPAPAETAQPEVPPLPVLPRAKPTPPPKEDEFESMLKDLALELKTETPPEDKPEPESDFLEDLAKSLDTPDRTAEPDQEVAQLAPILGNRLTLSEEDALSRHIEPCWNVQIGARNPEELTVDIRLYMNRDGTVRRAEVVDKGKMSSDRFYRAAAEAAMRAVLNERCQPLPIPPKKYEQLKSFVYRFDPSKMVGR